MSPSDHQSTLVRIAEWMEWIPGTKVKIGEDFNPQQGQMVEQHVAFHHGLTGFRTEPTEKVIDISVQPTGKSQIVEINDEVIVYGLYLFQAVLAKNVAANEFNSRINQQREVLKIAVDDDKERGRDKRGDLVVVQTVPQNMSPMPKQPPRRK